MPAPTENSAFQSLGPDDLLDAIESIGYQCDGRFLALNSYENRVYQIGIEDDKPIVAKFYRPNRWTDEAILEEHNFTLELAAEEIPVIPPLVDSNGGTMHHHGPFRFALYPRRGGRPPELDNPESFLNRDNYLIHLEYNLHQTYIYYHPTLEVEH